MPRTVHIPDNAGRKGVSSESASQAPEEVAAILEGEDASCAVLTPMVKAKLREIVSGEVLEVVSSEPTAEQDLKSWSNLTGNPLLAVRDDGPRKRFYIRKK